jgi:hypothetical protein
MGARRDRASPELSIHDARHRVIADAEERAISDHISDNHLALGLLFTDTGFIEIATMAFLENHCDKETPSEF